jgi:hypothetical protein
MCRSIRQSIPCLHRCQFFSCSNTKQRRDFCWFCAGTERASTTSTPAYTVSFILAWPDDQKDVCILILCLRFCSSTPRKHPFASHLLRQSLLWPPSPELHTSEESTVCRPGFCHAFHEVTLCVASVRHLSFTCKRVRVIGVAVLAWSALGRVVFFHALFKGVLVWVATPNLFLMNTNTNFTKRERESEIFKYAYSLLS